MAKQSDKPQEPQEAAVPDVNPELAFQRAWDTNVADMRTVVTRDARVRSGLRPSEATRGKEILRSYQVS